MQELNDGFFAIGLKESQHLSSLLKSTEII